MIDFTIKAYQQNIQINCNKENISIINEYFKYTNIPLKLNSKEISKIKSGIFGKIRDLTILECIKKISISNINLEILTKDIKYNN